jgi:hypothetical protein
MVGATSDDGATPVNVGGVGEGRESLACQQLRPGTGRRHLDYAMAIGTRVPKSWLDSRKRPVRVEKRKVLCDALRTSDLVLAWLALPGLGLGFLDLARASGPGPHRRWAQHQTDTRG